MPLSTDIAEKVIGPPSPGKVLVFVGPCSAKNHTARLIPLDGRKYRCDGVVILKNGHSLRAKFDVDTTSFDFLSLGSLLCHPNGRWYRWDEPQLYHALGVTNEDALPFQWKPDRPLAYHKPGPYPMSFFDKKEEADF